MLKFYKASKLNNYTFKELVLLNDGEKRADSVLYLINLTSTFNQLDHEITSNQSSFTLSIDKLNEDHFGIYMCIAGNRYGKSIKFINLQKKMQDYIYFIAIYVVFSVIIILMFLLCLQSYFKNRVKKKLIIEKQKSYIIKKKIIINYFAAKNDGNNLHQTDASAGDPQLNFYKNCPIFPRVEIVKERKEILNSETVNDELSKNEDCFEIDLDSNWEINRLCLKLDETIGHGNFGVVQRAFLYSLPLTPKENSNQKPIYVNDNVYSSIKSDDYKISDDKSTVTYTNINQLNYSYIIDHF